MPINEMDLNQLLANIRGEAQKQADQAGQERFPTNGEYNLLLTDVGARGVTAQGKPTLTVDLHFQIVDGLAQEGGWTEFKKTLWSSSPMDWEVAKNLVGKCLGSCPSDVDGILMGLNKCVGSCVQMQCKNVPKKGDPTVLYHNLKVLSCTGKTS